MSLKIPYINKNERIFFLAYGIMLISGILSTTFYFRYFEGLYKYIVLVCCSLLVFDEMRYRTINKFTFSGLLFCVGMFIIAFIGARGAEQNAVASIFLFAYSARRIPVKKVLFYTLFISSSLLAFIIISSYLGLIDNVLFVKKGRERWCLGFRYTLYAPTLFYNIVAVFAYYKGKTIKLWEFLVLLAIDYWLYQKTDSRSMAVFTAFILLYCLYLKYQINPKKKISRLYSLAIPLYAIASLASLYLVFLYTTERSPWLVKLDALLSGRLWLAMEAITKYGVHLFSQHLTMVGNGMNVYGEVSQEAYTYVDSFYIQILVHYGIIFFAGLIVVVTIAAHKIYKRSDALLLTIFSINAIHFLIDDLQINLAFNTFWMIIGLVLLETKKVVIHGGEMIG